MIRLVDKEICCGCEACRQACAISAIVIEEDEEGFLYPYVKDNCIECGKCIRACPLKEFLK